jgi:hypothetical protein
VYGLSSWMRILLQDARCNRMNTLRLRKYCCFTGLFTGRDTSPWMAGRCTFLTLLPCYASPCLQHPCQCYHIPPHLILNIFEFWAGTVLATVTFISLTLIFLHALWFIYLGEVKNAVQSFQKLRRFSGSGYTWLSLALPRSLAEIPK